MFLWALKITAISIILIFLIHNIVEFLTVTLTKPRDSSILDNKIQNYKILLDKMTEEITDKNKQLVIMQEKIHSSKPRQDPEEDEEGAEDLDQMKNELKQFLKDTLNTTPEKI
jgi:hypothetical protein